MILFGEPRNVMRVASLALVILGSMGMKFFS
jgi:multidrug transporter EmrE-like cation transporter